MEGEVKKFIDAIKPYCRPLTSPVYKNLERNLRSAAEKFNEKEESSKSEIITALSSYEKYLREKFKENFQKAEATVPYKTSRTYITGASSPSPENTTKERERSGSSKHSSSEQGTKKDRVPSAAKKDTRKNALNRVNMGGQKDGKPTQKALPQENKKNVLDRVNKGGQKDGKATPTPKLSANKDLHKVKVKSPSRDSTTLETKEWRTKFEEKDEEMNSLNEQVKLLAQELGFEGETSEKILTEAVRQLKSVKEQKNKDQTKCLKEYESSLESVKKAVFKVPKVKDKDHDLEKTITTIQDLHKQGEELFTLKKVLLDPNTRKDMKDSKMESKEATMNKILDLQRSLKELESSLEKVRKAVFKVPKAKDEDHDLERTITKIQDLHKQGEELFALKETVLNPNKTKDMKESETNSKEATIKRIHDLQSFRKACEENMKQKVERRQLSEQACLELKNIIFDEELKRLAFKNKPDEHQHSSENAKIMVENLKKEWKNIDADRNVLLETILGKETVQPTVNDALQRLQLLKRDQNDLQELLKAVSDMDDSLSAKQAVEKVQKLKKSVNDQNNTIQKQSEDLKRLETEISNKKEEISEMKKRYDNMKKSGEDAEQRLNNELKRMQAEKNNALTRLSEVAGAKLTNENPHITDLSDPNRPIKIGEQYSELYDNAWTDVFEKLTEECKMSDKEAIQMLLKILEISYRFCREIASKRYKNILAELTLLRLAVPDEKNLKKKSGSKEETMKGRKEETAQTLFSDEIAAMQKFFDSQRQPVDIKTLKSVLEKIGLSETDLKYIKNLLKITVEGTCHFVEQDIWGKRSEIQAQNDVHLEIAKPYLKKCVRICWFMVAQDPPVFLKASDKKDTKFDKDLYREFTSSGKKMDYVVWPALLLHEGGPLLKKGVAQPKT